MSNRPMLLFLGILVLTAAIGCREEERDVGPSRDPIDQAAIGGYLRISEDAQSAIGLATAKAVERDVPDSISTTGWLAARPASEVIVKAPATGFVIPRDDRELPLGESVTSGQHLASLNVFVSPQEAAQLVAAKEDADILVQQSLATGKLAEEQLNRLEETASTAVAGTRLLELREIVARSLAAEREAREKLPFLPKEPYGEELHLKAVPLDAPLSGRLVNVYFTARQLVVQGDPLWSISDWSVLWIRVPIYAADLPRIFQRSPASVVMPGRQESRMARPIDIPLPTDPGKQTVELWYEIDNAPGEMRPGQAVSISLPVGGVSSRIIIPRTALLWDGMGNTWVYVKSSDTSFRRRKVEPDRLLQSEIVIDRGLEKDEEIVTMAAESLYGEEFKWQFPAEDDE